MIATASASRRAARDSRSSAIAFTLVMLLCLALGGWWVYFQVRESRRLLEVDALLVRGDRGAAARALGAREGEDLVETARRRRRMFIAEGATLGAALLVGIAFFYLALLRERRLRQAQERFLAGASHELKTPLASVRLGIESLQAGSLPDARRADYLAAMLRELDRLDAGVGRVLAAADVIVQVDPSSVVDLAADVRVAVERTRERAAAARVEIRVEGARDLYIARRGAAVIEAVHNLLDNAIKYSAPEDVVTVALAREGSHAVLRVADRGVGIALADLPHVFDRCYRGKTGAHRGGTGLGLYLAARTVASLDGTLEVHSAGEGRGAEFVMRLPLQEAAG